MTAPCESPVSDDDLLEYWAGPLPSADAERIEEHLFSCASCGARLEAMASIGSGLAALVRQGRISRVVSRSLLNRMQRDGVHVRMYSLAPGERVPCAAFPDDDLLVLSLRGDFGGLEAVTVAMRGPDDVILGQASDVPVSPGDLEILWATSGDTVRRMPSSRVRLTVTSQAPSAVLAEYELDHTALPPL
jgi:anti-sigma factor RsiW